jgi:dTDP-D-glucose 4,6-dehydratase
MVDDVLIILLRGASNSGLYEGWIFMWIVLPDPQFSVKQMSVGTMNLLNAAKTMVWERWLEGKRFTIVLARDEVYGSLGRRIIYRNDSLWSCNSPYSASVKEPITLLGLMWKRSGLPYVLTSSSQFTTLFIWKTPNYSC